MSQSEIDSLLSALNSGDLDVSEIKEDSPQHRVKRYDFKSPKKLAKDQLRTLQIIHEGFARLFNTYLSGYLRTPTESEIISVEELSYADFSNSVSNPSLITILNFVPLPGQIIIEVGPGLALTMVDRILGGDGKTVLENRAFTEIELTLLTKLMRQAAGFFAEPWENVIELAPEIDKIETNPQFAQIVSPNETVALITLRMKIGSSEGFMNLCLPHIVLEPIISKLSTKFWFSSTEKELKPEEKDSLRDRVRSTSIELSALLGETSISVEEFIFLQVGDVIRLPNRVTEDLPLLVGRKMKFLGQPGARNNNMAFRITEVIEKGEEDGE